MSEARTCIKSRYAAMEPVLDEQGRRRWAASEALAYGRGGVTVVAQETGMARSTINRGIREVQTNQHAGRGRVRRGGGGRKKKTVTDPALEKKLKSLVEPTTGGDPMRPLLWTSRSLRNICAELNAANHNVSPQVVGNLLRSSGYSLQANRKSRDGNDHPDRDAQFRYINDRIADFLASDDPVLSVDTKKKELVGNFKNNGQTWRPEGTPEDVSMHDFRDKKLGRAVPCGVYAVNDNSGWMSVGNSHDTSAFAVNAIRRWWQTMGRKRFPHSKRILITADSGGSNGYRVRLWKAELQKLADELRVPITVCHFPRGTSKWNKIEHKLFSFVSINWRGKPLRTFQTIVQLIAATTTKTGLKVHAELDTNIYPKGVRVSKDQFKTINLTPHNFHGEWNYTILPHL
jgi:hypothetical protein